MAERAPLAVLHRRSIRSHLRSVVTSPDVPAPGRRYSRLAVVSFEVRTARLNEVKPVLNATELSSETRRLLKELPAIADCPLARSSPGFHGSWLCKAVRGPHFKYGHGEIVTRSVSCSHSPIRSHTSSNAVPRTLATDHQRRPRRPSPRLAVGCCVGSGRHYRHTQFVSSKNRDMVVMLRLPSDTVTSCPLRQPQPCSVSANCHHLAQCCPTRHHCCELHEVKGDDFRRARC